MSTFGKVAAVVEKHPLATAAGVFAVGVVIVLYYSSGGATTQTSGTSTADETALETAEAQAAAASTAQQTAALQAGVSVASINAGLQATQANDNTAVTIAQVQGTNAIGLATAQGQQNVAAIGATSQAYQQDVAEQNLVQTAGVINQTAAEATAAGYLVNAVGTATDNTNPVNAAAEGTNYSQILQTILGSSGFQAAKVASP